MKILITISLAIISFFSQTFAGTEHLTSAEGVPDPMGAYSIGVSADHILYLSGQLGINPKTGKLVDKNIILETKQALKNIRAASKMLGASLNNTVKLNIYLMNMNDYKAVNRCVEKFFKKPYPSRVIVGVSNLADQAHIEISATIALKKRTEGS